MMDVAARQESSRQESTGEHSIVAGFALDRIAAQIDAACTQACAAIAPAWPLDRAIAVNPHWSRIGLPVRRVAARMAVLGGISVFPPRAQVQDAWAQGRISADDLADAIHAEGADAVLSPEACMQTLGQTLSVQRLPLLIDLLDDDPARQSRLSWRSAITHQVSQACAAWFDADQADWQPDRRQGLYAFWRETLQHDHGIGLLMGLPRLAQAVDALPATARDAERWALERLGLPESAWADYLEAVLLTVNGWASWCAYLGWQANLSGKTDPHLRELLAIRLAWGALLLGNKDDDSIQRAFVSLRRAWQQAPRLFAEAEAQLLVDAIWQRAWEQAYQRKLAERLSVVRAVSAPQTTPAAQAMFCIDVRSEPMRRALEAASPAIQTLGFAGFFGIPAAYAPIATPVQRPQLPGLLAPAVLISERVEIPGVKGEADDTRLDAIEQGRRTRFALRAPWSAATRWPGAAFSFVESAGFGYLGKLAGWLHPGLAPRRRDDLAGLDSRAATICRPQVVGLDPEARVDLAARVLRAMGLADRLAPLVLLVGHGSQSVNNAQAAALECGACCGQSGEVNARALAQLLNDVDVRGGLGARGIHVPEATWFVPALHNTTTDALEVFDQDLMPGSARAAWAALEPAFAQAADQVRRERAPKLGIDPRLPAETLHDALRRRGNDGAQTRPEWGLANNAAFVIAPRARTRGVNLEGRVFLHDYAAEADTDGSLLELLMTAPMLVTHWINWQYHASTCDPVRLGSGNKLLHNVVGGTIGVFEGNGGDLRIGLSRQSLHDGQRWMHEPLRLTVVIDAPEAAIDAVIAKHAVVRQLLDHGWLHLWRFGETGFAIRDGGAWREAPVPNG